MLATAESEKPDDEETSEGADAVCLSSVLGIKANQLDNQWNHFVDHHHIPFNVRVVPGSRLYLQIHVLEYPTEAILRSLSMDVFATWLVDQEEMRLLQKRQAKMRADEAKAKAAEEEQARLAAEAQKAAEAEQARQAAEAQRAAEEEKARQAAEAQKAADEELARQAAEAQKAADEELARQAAEAQKAADEELARKAAEAQKAADDEQARLAAEAQNAADEPDANVGKPADEEMQEKIRKALERLPADRKCPAGYAWVQNSTGFTCGGAHSITWEELDALADSGGLDGSDDDGTEEL
ncbi:uncharacterized protein EDB93DRAFT_833030 [Suillus bovinus]|uniref:uncharacterized protein n=1 Tax=Suillus bovinus TaxID=48563 RepID=UPI001B879B59|nr:uncharacterized protein EDB93DRAFT_833030 [Suillus bovinus]KAG2135229.1 hypothetical protein EDB93DRAFT_833030 [Suillus bovinus]